MKKIYILRHAKSSWKNETLSDFERPLNERGKRDAPLMGLKLSEVGIKPDLILSSAANRAYTTATIIADKMNYPLDGIEKRQDLYLASANKILKMINFLENKHNSVMVVGHNPGLTDLANELGGLQVANMPTCALVALEFSVDEWQAVSWGLGKNLLFEYPKKGI
ncbi:MAG: histidine phosphatase family protein [Calditrichaeota bacterium]|nr:MAG: histidine phosphatase family protein [Calditrichota bacterium]MBL1205744.1 histidine phosphatase family protein [Calditrichota bacterium]NOG45572.1 histidine phosphatase family protein [Calditrichota bacterium]